MSIAAIGAGMAGLVRGHQMAEEDKRKAEDQKFLNEQRGRQRQDWADADALKGALTSIRPAGTYEDVDPLAAAEGLEPSMLPKTRVTRTDADVMQDQARAFQKFGKVQEAAQMTGAARQTKREDRTDKLTGERDAVFREAGEMWADLRAGDMNAFRAKWGERFNADQIGGPQYAGYKVQFNPEGTKTYIMDPQGAIVREAPWNPQTARSLVEEYLDGRLSTLSAEDYQQTTARGLDRRKTGAAETTARAAADQARAAGEKVQVDREYKDFLASRPNIAADGTGRLVSISSDGTRQLGVFGSARPIVDRVGGGGGANAIKDPAGYDAAVKEYNDLAVKYQTSTDPQERNRLRAQIQVTSGKIANAMGKPMQLRDEKPQLGFKELTDFIGAFGSSPSGIKDTKTGAPILISQLPVEQQMAIASRMLGGGDMPGGLPSVPPPTRGQALTPGLQRPTDAPYVPERLRAEANSYQAAVDALRAQQQELARRIPSLPPEQQAAAAAQMRELGTQLTTTAARARELGVTLR